MPVETARLVVSLLESYFWVGALFALAFAWRGAARLDPGAAHGSLGFRLLLLPGALLLWPLLLWRCLRPIQVVEKNAHRSAATCKRNAV